MLSLILLMMSGMYCYLLTCNRPPCRGLFFVQKLPFPGSKNPLSLASSLVLDYYCQHKNSFTE